MDIRNKRISSGSSLATSQAKPSQENGTGIDAIAIYPVVCRELQLSEWYICLWLPRCWKWFDYV